MSRIGHLPEIGGINLGVSAKQAEILIDNRRIEVYSQSLRQISRQPLALFVEVIQVVFEAYKGRADPRRIIYRCHDSSLLFLGRKPFCKNVESVFDKKIGGLGRRHDSIRFLS